MAIAGIFHTGLTASDLDGSLRFRRDRLGLELVAQRDPEDIALELVEPAPARRVQGAA